MLNRRSLLKLLGLTPFAPLAAKAAAGQTGWRVSSHAVILNDGFMAEGVLEPGPGSYRNVRFISPLHEPHEVGVNAELLGL